MEGEGKRARLRLRAYAVRHAPEPQEESLMRTRLMRISALVVAFVFLAVVLQDTGILFRPW